MDGVRSSYSAATADPLQVGTMTRGVGLFFGGLATRMDRVKYRDLYQPFGQPLRQYFVLLAGPAVWSFVKFDKIRCFWPFRS
jgi:hypothetical protein